MWPEVREVLLIDYYYTTVSYCNGVLLDKQHHSGAVAQDSTVAN